MNMLMKVLEKYGMDTIATASMLGLATLS